MKRVLFFLLALMLLGCNKSLDLSTVELGSDANKYDLDSNESLEKNIQKGHYEWKKVDGNNTVITVDNGEKTVNYYEIGRLKNQFNYAGIPTDSTWDTKIVVYKGIIAEVNATIAKDKAFLFIENILKKLGTPSSIIDDSKSLKENIAKISYNKFHEFFPKNTKLVKGNLYELTYPSAMIWNKSEVLYILNFMLDTNGDVTITYRPMTKKACKDRVLYPAPQKESPFYEYLK
jgi:hypothetical protein